MSTTYNEADPYAGSRETTEGRVYTVTGGDWDLTFADPHGEERLVVNMGPQHPSTHGVLRLVLDLEGETVTKARVVIGYLHTGIEKNTEYRNWTQGTTFVTRMDYLSPLFNEAGYCMAVEKLLGVEVPQRARTIRVLVMELNRIASHLVALATFGMEMGALTGMTNGFREREMVLDLLEEITGLRMNHAYIRPGGLAQDLPEGSVESIREFLKIFPSGWPTSTGCSPVSRSGRTGSRTPATSTSPAAWRWASPGRCCGRPVCPGTCARSSRISVTRPMTSRCRPRTPATPGAATWSAWRR